MLKIVTLIHLFVCLLISLPVPAAQLEDITQPLYTGQVLLKATEPDPIVLHIAKFHAPSSQFDILKPTIEALEKTFGKGSVQTIIPLGNYGAMRLTTARYYTPSGRSIQATGIVPDVEVKPAKVEEIDKGMNFSEAEFGNALKNDAQNIAHNKISKKDDSLKKDYQLSRAVDLVKALNIYKSGIESQK